MTLCDLSKAFDSVSHKLLLNKLFKLNIDRFWFPSYIQNRTQSVRISSTTSEKASISYGVPQGSILGPILFSIFVNDLEEKTDACSMIQYADDTQFLEADTVDNHDNLISNTENTLRNIKSYFLTNGLLLNPKKTQCIFIGNRQLLSRIPPDTFINCNGVRIYPSTHVKNLGVYFNRYMLFDVHIAELGKKITGMLIFINRVSDCFDKTTRKTVVQSLVLSMLNYCISIWGCTNKNVIHSAQKLQNFAAKIAFGGARKYDHVTPILKELEWMTIKHKYVFEKCSIVYKAVNGLYPEWYLKFHTVRENTGSRTRQENKLNVQGTRTDSGARATAVCGPKFWNDLPHDLIKSKSLPVFKASLKNLLLKNDN